MLYSQYLTEKHVRNTTGLLGETSISFAMVDPAELIHGILADPGSGGAVLVGPAGNGRQDAFEAAFSRLDGQPELIRLNGTSFALHVPRGALAFLLSRLDVGIEASRHEIIHGLAGLLCPEGRPAVVLLGRPELVDEQSASILAQLAAMRKIVLVVVCERLQDLPQDVLSLYRSGRLARVTMRSMDMGETRSFLEHELGNTMSMLAAATLRYLTDNNRDLMLKLARIWVSEGQLQQHRGVWVLRLGTLGGGPALNAMMNSMLSGLKQPERRLLQALAIGGPIALDMVHRNGLARELDALCGSGHAHVAQGHVAQVEIGVPLLSLLLREGLDEDLRPGVEESLARLHTDPVAAQARTSMRALVDIGAVQEMVAVAEAFGVEGFTAEAWPRDPEHRIAILNLHVKALLSLHRAGDAATLLAGAETGFRDVRYECGLGDRMASAGQELEILKSRVLRGAGGGPAADVLQSGGNPVDCTEWHTESLHLRALTIQILGWAARSRQSDALNAVEQISSDLAALRINGQFEELFSADEAAELEAMILQTQLTAGNWRGAALRAQVLASGQYPNPRVVAYADAVQGILFGLFDEAEHALQVLNPAMQQFVFTPDAAERAAVEAVATYSLVSMGRSAEATELLLKEPEPARSEMPLNFFSWVAEVFSSLSVARINDLGSGQSRLAAFADKAHGAGYAGLEMHTLALALRLGHFEETDRFQRVAMACQGAVALQFARLAGSIRQGDKAGMLDVLEELARSGQVLLAVPASNALIDALDTKDQRRLATSLSRLKRQCADSRRRPFETDQEPVEKLPSWMKELTKRESQVALLAIDGHGNSEIARSSGVSIRTVEGHLYQVYSKLQVRNRQELTALDRATRRAAGKR
ncbi:LuxR C-terminal-related transcriptional regulator [Paeniglutamicibacter sp. MACA_103]|uniref:helix-turn-helix transcriptional regulator n=1 Tax=Paeniglutamicibacter sp. MACA_103 TaxID=3377337 RepID=UPI0038966F6C